MSSILLFLVLVARCEALEARWLAYTKGNPQPARSGPTAAATEKGVVLFSGYAEESKASRRVIRDLWEFDEGEGWSPLYSSEDGPGPRLCSAGAICENNFVIFGGWDPQEEGTGGIILADIWSLELDSKQWTKLSETIPRGPCSRHIACTLPTGKGIVVHSFRCIDSVMVYEDGKMYEQATIGEAPSSRGLHSAAMVGNELVVFGGADKSGQMRNDVYALDTTTWTWREVSKQNEQNAPTPRAGSCAVALGDARTFIVCCGAQRDDQDSSLKPRADLWALDLPSGTWTKLLDDSDEKKLLFPRPRNAAVLVPLFSSDSESTTDRFLLHGGWHPFLTTFDDSFILEIVR